MRNAIRVMMGAIAGIFIVFALLQVFFAMPIVQNWVTQIVDTMYLIFIIGSVIFFAGGVIILYFAIKKR